MQDAVESDRQRKSMMKSLNDELHTTEGANDSPNHQSSNYQRVRINPDLLEQQIQQASLNKNGLNYEKNFGNRSQSLAPPVISQKQVSGEAVQEEFVLPSKKVRTSVSPSKVTSKLMKKQNRN